MPRVTNPLDGADKADSTFEWTMEGIAYASSKVIVGSVAGSDNVYAGTEFPNGTTKDDNVTHPHNGKIYYTRVKYRTIPGGPWFTTNCPINKFKSI